MVSGSTPTTSNASRGARCVLTRHQLHRHFVTSSLSSLVLPSILSPALADLARELAPLPRPVGLLVMLSGRGRTLSNLIDACRDGVLRRAADIRLVIASSDSPGAQLARDASIPTRIIPGTIPAADLAALALDHACSLVILAGYLRKVEIHPSLARRILNIHPALLTHDHDPAPLLSRGMRESDLTANFGGPGLFGNRVHRAVIASGEPISGCTVHLCDAAFDTGPILLRRTCPVEPNDTAESLAARVFVEERIAYPEAIARALGVWNPNAPGASNP